MDLISVKNLGYRYPESTKNALNNVSLTVDSGEFVLLMGASGSGKTTLLEAIAGVIPYSLGGTIEGELFIEGCDIVRHPNEKRGVVGLVLQDPEPQLISLDVSDEIRFAPENLCLPRDEVDARLEWALDRCRLNKVRNAFVYALSGGQKQRIVIAAGLAMRPRIMLMDGPVTNLDPKGAREVLAVIEEVLGSSDTETVILSANKVDPLLPLATRVLVMDKGELVLDGPPEDVIGEHADILESLGLFVPEVGRVFVSLPQSQRGHSFPVTVEDLAASINHHPFPQPIKKPVKSQPPDVVVGLDDVWFNYPNQPPVLQGISLEVRRGEAVAILGQNGSGKTTLMNLIAGLRMPKKGNVLVNGIDTSKLPPGLVGYVFQYPEHQFVSSSVYKELAHGLVKLGMPDGEVKRKVADVLELFGLSDLRDGKPYSLSMGEKRLLSVATMVIMEPEVLILDEPTTGLDNRLTSELMSILNRLVEEKGITLLQVSHDMEQIAEYSERVIVIDSGNVICDSTPRELFVNQSVLQTAKLEAPPVARLAQYLWPDNGTRCPITVSEFLESLEVQEHAAD